jgi:hypothetical protein
LKTKDCESQSGGSEDSETAFDNLECLKVAVAAVVAGITFNFRTSGVVKAWIVSMENYVCYFPKGYCWATGVESMRASR